MHPDTYLNKVWAIGHTFSATYTDICYIKVVIASEEGTMQLWNIKTGKLVYQFKGWGAPIKCVVQSPALDVVGIGK